MPAADVSDGIRGRVGGELTETEADSQGKVHDESLAESTDDRSDSRHFG